jgi:hypothetical protein
MLLFLFAKRRLSDNATLTLLTLLLAPIGQEAQPAADRRALKAVETVARTRRRVVV